VLIGVRALLARAHAAGQRAPRRGTIATSPGAVRDSTETAPATSTSVAPVLDHPRPASSASMPARASAGAICTSGRRPRRA
jgi:hypothetical protein